MEIKILSTMPEFYVAEIWSSSQLIFVTSGFLADVVQPKKIRHREWREKISKTNTEIWLRLHGPYPDPAAAEAVAETLRPVAVWREEDESDSLLRERRQVICRETHQIFHSVNDAAKSVGSSSGNLSRHLAKKPGFKTIKGRTFSFLNELPDDYQQWAIQFNIDNNLTTEAIERQEIAIINLTTGKVFKSKKEVCETLRISSRDVTDIIEKTHRHGAANLWNVSDCPSEWLPDWIKHRGKNSA